MKTSSKTQTFLKSRVYILFLLQKCYSLVNLLYKYKKLDINWKKNHSVCQHQVPGILNNFTFTYLFLCVCVQVSSCQRTLGGQRRICRSQFSLSTMWEVNFGQLWWKAPLPSALIGGRHLYPLHYLPNPTPIVFKCVSFRTFYLFFLFYVSDYFINGFLCQFSHLALNHITNFA